MLIVLAGIALVAWRTTRREAVPVILATVDRGRVEQTVTNTRAGTVQACRRARLAPSSGGQIVSLPKREGDHVKAGDILLELWSQENAAQTRVAQEQVRAATLRAQEACLNADIAGRDFDRARKLHEDGLLPDDQLDRAESTSKALRTACRAAGAEIGRSDAAVQLARATMTRTVLRAPFDGVLAKINGEVGEFTTPSPPGIPTPPVVDLIDDSCIYVSAPIDEVDVAAVRVGQAATISVEAIAGRRFAGRVRRIAPFVQDLEKQARTVDVEVELADPADARMLIVGYSADIEIILDSRERVVRVPTQALREGGKILVRDERGILRERRVEKGISNWAWTEIRSGVREGERVALSVERAGVVDGALTSEEPPERQ